MLRMLDRRFLIIFILPVLAITSLAVTGCDRAALHSGEATSGTPPRNSSNAEHKALPDTKKDVKRESEPDTKTIEIVLYFSDSQAEKLVKEVRSVSATEAVAQVAVKELINGPQAGGFATIPDGTHLLGVDIKDQVAEVDLSKEFIENHPGGSAGERITVYSIVNTLTEFSTIKQVRFLVDGAAIDTIVGHMDVSQPLQREESLL